MSVMRDGLAMAVTCLCVTLSELWESALTKILVSDLATGKETFEIKLSAMTAKMVIALLLRSEIVIMGISWKIAHSLFIPSVVIMEPW